MLNTPCLQNIHNFVFTALKEGHFSYVFIYNYYIKSIVMRKLAFCICEKKKMQISFEVTTKLISAFVFATWLVQFLYILITKFQASNHLLWLCSPVCVGHGQNPRRPVFSQRDSYYYNSYCTPYIEMVGEVHCFQLVHDSYRCMQHMLLWRNNAVQHLDTNTIFFQF